MSTQTAIGAVTRAPEISRWRSLVTQESVATLVVSALDNGGKVSKRRRKQFEGRVPDAVFDFIEEVAAQGDDAPEESGR